MPIITLRTEMAASQQTNNILEGSSFEFLEETSIVRFLAVVETLANYDVQCLFQIGGVTLIQPPFGLIFPPVRRRGEHTGGRPDDPERPISWIHHAPGPGREPALPVLPERGDRNARDPDHGAHR